MNDKRLTRLVWLLCVLCIGGGTYSAIAWLVDDGIRTAIPFEDVLVWGGLMPILFSLVAALIISRQPRNGVGWLLMLVALTAAPPIENLLAVPPAVLTPGMWLLIWYNGWSWIPVIFPIFLIPLNFPTGRPPSRRWNWVNWLALGMWLIFIALGAFTDPMISINFGWTIPNPLGVIPVEVMEGPFLVFWGIGLMTMLLASVISLVLRYRRAAVMERQQIKWLLYAGVMLVITYPLNFALSEIVETGWVRIFAGILFVLPILGIVVAIGVAILRYRLYDIDILIRRTLIYSVLSSLLALTYFGLVVILQGTFTTVSGQSSPVVIVISTLAIAGLFFPLRARVQEFIDRRFFRRKYDAQKVLADFAATARDETDLDTLATRLVEVAGETMQPESVSVWLASTTAIQRRQEHEARKSE